MEKLGASDRTGSCAIGYAGGLSNFNFCWRFLLRRNQRGPSKALDLGVQQIFIAVVSLGGALNCPRA